MRKAMHNKKHLVNIVGAFLLVLLLAPILFRTVTAVQNVENTYAVVVTTGNDAGDNVTYFGLQYVDTAGYTHTEYVFPHKGGLEDAYQMVNNGGNYTNEKPLDRGKTNTYFFTPTYEVAQVLGLDIYCQGEQGELYAWDVSGLRLYRVDQILDIVSNGENNIIRFNGMQIACLEERNGNNGVTFSWTGNSLFQLRQQETSYRLIFEDIPFSMDADCEYAVRLDFADISGAGVEQLNQPYDAMAGLGAANFGEYLAIEIEYVDTYGDSRAITQPVIKSAVNYMLKNGIPADAKIAGFAQQGDSIVIDCTLQDMAEVKAVMLYTGREADAVLAQSVNGSESISLTGVSIYNASTVGVSLPSMENSACGPEYTFSEAPLFYHTATAVSGETVSADNSHYISMRAYESGAALVPRNNTEKYLIELLSVPSQITRVPDDVMISLQYVDLQNNVQESETFSVRSGAREFYGHWPASADDFGYVGQINNGTGIQFVVELPQVEHFTRLRVSVPEGSSDWQMAGIRMTRLDEVSKRYCVWEDMIAQGAISNRRYFRESEGYMVFSMDEAALIQPGSPYELNFVSQSVQPVEDFDWRDFRYSMTYEQCCSNLGLAKVRANYTVEVQVQSGTTSLLDGYGDNGSKNRFYFLLEFADGDSGYVLANQQLSADGFRSGCTESFTVSTNYDYGELIAVHVIPDDTSEDSDPYDKLNIAQIRVRRNDKGSISKEWVIQNVGWIGIDYRDEGASGSIAGLKGRSETEISRVYPVSYSSYALNLELRIGTGAYNESGSGGPFYGTMEATLEYYDKDGRRNQLTFDAVRAMYDYANKVPVYLNDGTTGSTGTPLAVTNNSFMFRENHTDRFVVSVSNVSKLGKMTLNMKSLNGGSLQVTNVTAALVLESGMLQINGQDEYMRMGKTEYLCEDTVDKIPAFELTLPTGRNIYQDIYFTDHEPIKLDEDNNTWISTVSRVPNSNNDTINVYVYPAEDASGSYSIDVRAQYTDANGNVMETAATDLTKGIDMEGRTVYSALDMRASGMSTLNRVYVKAQSADLVDAYIDHMVVQQVRSGVVINTFYLNCEHRNAEMEFYVLPSNMEEMNSGEQKVYLSFGQETEEANLIAENRDVAVALRYTTMNDGRNELTSKYVYITDQQYQSIKAGDLVELTFHESYVQNITGIMIATSGNVKAQVDMAVVDNYRVDTKTDTKQLLKHHSFPTGVTVMNQMTTITPSEETAVEVFDVQFTTALADAYLESGTTAPIIMVVGYVDSQGVQKELVVQNIRDYVISDGEAFSAGSTTQIRMLIRDIVAAQYLQLMPYDFDPQSKAVWKPGQIVVSVGADGSLQKVSRSVDTYIYEDKELDFEKEITGKMVGGLKVNLSNIIVTADVKHIKNNGSTGNAYRVTSAANKTLSLTVFEKEMIDVKVDVANSEQGFTVKAERMDTNEDISSSEDFTVNKNGFVLTLPEEKGIKYRITVSSKENDKVAVVIELTVPGEAPTVPAPTPSTQPTVPAPTPSTEPTVPTVEDPSTDPTVPPAEDPTTDPTDPPAEDPTTEPTVPPAEDPTTDPTVPPAEDPSTEPTEMPTEEPSTEPTETPTEEPSTEDTEPPTEATETPTESTESST